MFRFENDTYRCFETLDEALEAAEFEGLDTVVLDRSDCVVARYRPGSGVEWPVGWMTIYERAAIHQVSCKTMPEA